MSYSRSYYNINTIEIKGLECVTPVYCFCISHKKARLLFQVYKKKIIFVDILYYAMVWFSYLQPRISLTRLRSSLVVVVVVVVDLFSNIKKDNKIIYDKISISIFIIIEYHICVASAVTLAAKMSRERCCL